MEDIAPELLARIEQEFEKRVKSDSLLADLAAKLEAGTATHTEAYEYAGRVGEILTDAYQHNIASSSLPDGKLWYNIANRVITPTMKNNYDIISKYVTDVQTSLNKAAGIGIKALPPDMDVSDKILGIVNRVSGEESYDDIKWILQEPVKTFGRNVVDSSIRTNVEFQGKAGLTPKIVRKTSGSCCKWCTALAGTYTYPDVPRDVYRRHDNCRCTVNFDPGNGKIQNVHSGKEGKRRYVQDKYGGYTKTKEDRIAHAKEMAATEEARKAEAREKRITTWKRKKENGDILLEKQKKNDTIELEVVKDAIESGKVSASVNVNKQSRHIKNGTTYIPGRSYIIGNIEDAQRLVNELSGTGTPIMDSKGNWTNKERVESKDILGTYVDVNKGTESKTTKAIIVYSKTGSHIIPRKDG